MKNLLSLHEAIVVALININKETFTATFDEIASYIEKRNLYPERKGNVALATQVMLRSTKSKGKYSYLFSRVGENQIKINTKFKMQKHTVNQHLIETLLTWVKSGKIAIP